MTSLRRFRCTDLLRLSPVNLDALTETYLLTYYTTYAIRWPDCFTVVQQPYAFHLNSSTPHPPSHPPLSSLTSSPSLLAGYNMGKVEGPPATYHGHVSALSISPSYRRLSLAQSLMSSLEAVSDRLYHALFVDLYVRQSNALAIAMYKRLGYVVYRQVIGYYMGEEDAYDMRKALGGYNVSAQSSSVPSPRLVGALSGDPEKKSMVPLPHPVHPQEGD